MSDSALTQLSTARAALAECKTIMEAKDLTDLAATHRDFLRRTEASKEAVDEATAVWVLSTKKLGEFLAEMPKNEGTKGQLSGSRVELPPAHAPTLAEMGITKDESARAQKLAALSDEEVHARIDAAKDKGRLTMAAVVNPPAQEVVYDASTDEEQVEVLAPTVPTVETVECSDGVWKLMEVWRRTTKRDRLDFLQRIGVTEIPATIAPSKGRLKRALVNVGLGCAEYAKEEIESLPPDHPKFSHAHETVIRYCEYRIKTRKEQRGRNARLNPYNSDVSGIEPAQLAMLQMQRIGNDDGQYIEAHQLIIALCRERLSKHRAT